MDNPTLISADQLLRLHVINARLNKEKERSNVYAVVTIGKKAAKTDMRPLVGPKDAPKTVDWEEHFAIEYEKNDEESTIQVDVYAKATLKDDLLGEFKLRLGDIDPPKEKSKDKKKDKKEEKEISWAASKPKEVPLNDKKGNQVGTITLRIRRELKLYGVLSVDLKEVEIENEIDGDPTPIFGVVKLNPQRFEANSSAGKAGKTTATTVYVWRANSNKLKVDQTNHVYDVFIEIRRKASAVELQPDPKSKSDDKKNVIDGDLLGEARLALYDTRSKFSEQLVLYDRDHKQVGFVKVLAKLKKDKNGLKKAKAEAKK
eukprot:TRINITY_DN3409_c0_g1_i1.p1 TRINITY_DN3409_c0_g1~~TRINITY_DN3409_c0_g1_i1.p1  ORF type:complete len:316 (-),score=119.07 TRINITY_DN3409_c0_g1_i1:136-1083(-)